MSNENAAPAPATDGARKRNMLDDFKLRIIGDMQPGGTKRATLAVLAIANQVRLRAASGIPDQDGRDWLLEAKMDAATAYAMLVDLKKAVADREFGRRAITCKTGRDPIVLDTTVIYGRDQDKSLYIGLVNADKSRRIQFILRPTEYHELSGPDGRQLDPALVSEWFATGWITMMENLVASTLAVNYTDRLQSDPDVAPKSAPQGAGQGGGQGGYQQRQGGGGGWNGNRGGGGGNWNRGGNGGGGYQQRQGGGNWNRGGGQGGGGGYQRQGQGGGGGYQQRQGGGGGYQQQSGGGYQKPAQVNQNRDYQPEPPVFDDDTSF